MLNTFIKWLQSYCFRQTAEVLHSRKHVADKLDIFDGATVVKFLSGELNATFYDNEAFLDKLRTLAMQGADIEIIFGPALFVNTMKFWKIAFQYKNIKSYSLAYRIGAHFKLIHYVNGSTIAIVDKPHSTAKYEGFRGSVLLTKGYQEDILCLINKFCLCKEVGLPINKENLIEHFSRRNIEPGGDLIGFITMDQPGRISLASDDQIVNLERFLCENEQNMVD